VVHLARDAAGHGSFVDPTPAENEEVARARSSSALRALDPEAVDNIDLLTIVEHELGHVLGMDDLDPQADDLMSSTSPAGLRRRLGPTAIDAVLGASYAVAQSDKDGQAVQQVRQRRCVHM
jgi:hypothetical protein